MEYHRRIIDDILEDVFPHLAAIALEGAKGVGKTATGPQRASTVLSLDKPADRAAVAAHLDLATEVDGPVLIDEWQLEPAVWGRVRQAVDDDSTGGRFLLREDARTFSVGKSSQTPRRAVGPRPDGGCLGRCQRYM